MNMGKGTEKTGEREMKEDRSGLGEDEMEREVEGDGKRGKGRRNG